MDTALVVSDAQAEPPRRHHMPHPTLVVARARQAESCCGCTRMYPSAWDGVQRVRCSHHDNRLAIARARLTTGVFFAGLRRIIHLVEDTKGAPVAEVRTYLTKAAESLMSAQIDFTAARYNSCANRAYYACFQAAVAALLAAGIRPASPRGEWSHEFVQSQFNGLLIMRRKRYPAALRRVLRDTMAVRDKADYTPASVSARVASRVLQAAQAFVQAIQETVR
jgi:uncharacterized protein (UPF0332 family)